MEPREARGLAPYNLSGLVANQKLGPKSPNSLFEA